MSTHDVICRTRLIVHIANSLSRQFLESEHSFVKTEDSQIHFRADTRPDVSAYKSVQEYITWHKGTQNRRI